MANLETIVEAMRDRIEAQVSGLTRAREIDTITNESSARIDGSFAVWPERSRNLGERRPSGGNAAIEDTITVELAGQLVNIGGAGHAASLATLLAKCRNVRVALTAPAWWKANGISCVEWTSERRVRREGWVVVSQTYTLRRDGTLG